LAVQDKSLKRDKYGLPISQVFNKEKDDFVVSEGEDGKIYVMDQDLIERLDAVISGINSVKVRGLGVCRGSYYGSSNITIPLDSAMTGFEISNDGPTNLTYTINNITTEVKTGEVDIVEFAPFTSVTITTTSAYRARVYG
jgi:hypothetical protein